MNTINSQIPNQYYLLDYAHKSFAWDIYDTAEPADHLLWTTYFSKILQTVEQHLAGSGLIFYLTREELDFLPSYGDNVVVIIAGNEWCQIPSYSSKVLAIFKTYGIKPFLGSNPLRHPSYANFISLIQFLRTWLICLPRKWQYYYLPILRNRLSGTSKAPEIYTIPLGYYNQSAPPMKELKDRAYDVFFGGSVYNDSYRRHSLKSFIIALLKAPKTLAREKMLFHLKDFQAKHPEARVELSLTTGFFAMQDKHLQTYPESLMNSKICLIPRGTSYETFRFYEAIRFGCIPIVESLPPHWFYNGSPAITTKSWKDLNQILTQLLNTPSSLEEKHQQALWWWQNKCSEEPVGHYIAKQLDNSKTRLPSA